MTDTEGEPDVLTLTISGRTLEFELARQLDDLGARAVRAGEKPYWAVLWPSARALSELVAAIPEEDFEGRRLLDLGCGLGATGFVAAAKGATVVMADIRPEAVEYVGRNAARNGLDVEARVVDWDDPPDDLGQFDSILAADVFYEDGMLRGVLRFVRHHLKGDGLAWIADPHRVMPGGVEGAAKLHGLECYTSQLTPGRTMEGGVVLYELEKRKSRFGLTT